MHNQAQIKVINRPAKMLDGSNDQLDMLIRNLRSYLEGDLPESVHSLTVAFVFNYPIGRTLKGSPETMDEKTSLWVVNYPSDTGDKEDVGLAVIKMYLHVLKGLFGQEAAVQSLDIIVLYNKPYSALKLDDSFAKPPGPKEDDLSVFVPIKPLYRLDQLVLNDHLITQIKSTLKVLGKADLIYNVWGFGEIEPAPKAILNFYGPPGTGKTMAAHAVADYRKSKLLALNYADIESKYVGVAPKNLVKAFEMAQNENAVLFFDEADSFLGKRISNVMSNADQSVNSLRSQMLMLLDNFSGIVIFATNLIENYDRAFESRIFRHLLFEMPDAINRKKIIGVTMPPRLPYEQGEPFNSAQLDELVELSDGFSGRYIKNAILIGLINIVVCDREMARFSDFQDSFNEVKTTIDVLKNAAHSGRVTKIDPKLKETIEQKIQDGLKEGNKVVIENLNGSTSKEESSDPTLS